MSEGPVLFCYHPQQPFPNSVSLAGEFNSWSPTPLFYSDVSSRFETTVMLEDGKNYCYKFVIDGNWILAPNAETVWENGIANSIIRVTSDKFVKSPSEPEPGRAAEPEAAATELQFSVTESETSATEPEAPVIEAEVSAAELETPAKEQETPVTEPETPDAGPELVSSSVITSEGYVLVQKANAELTKSDETAESLETKIEEEAAPIQPTVNEAAKYVETKVDEVAAAVKPKTEEDAAPLEAEVVATVEKTISSITPTLTKTVESAIATAAEVAGSAAMIVTENAEAVKEIVSNTISAGMEALNSTPIPDTDPNIAVGLPAVVPEVVNTESEPALTSSSEEAANALDVSAAPSDMSSIERVVTANTTITTPELTTPVKEDATKNLLPDAVPSPVLEVSAESSVPEVPAETPSSATPAITAEPSTGSPKEPAIGEAITAGNDTAISIPAETPAEPHSDPDPAGPARAYETATKSKQPGLLAMFYDFVSASVVGKLFQYVFSIFNRSA
ncbi:hypothetical protein V1508DRAFT_419602 [Lipomyces doorenjongii]|uniref:uncharacterized protein n=1 Tax=Lipomyces doorenjongii TaxID=383834 RepID=UPI0034CE578D